MLRLEAVDAFYGDVQILFAIGMEVRKNEIVTILGSNGAGKTTTIKCICNLLPIKAGAIHFEDLRLDAVPAYRLANLGISLVPEGRRLFPAMSVRDNLLLGAYILRDRQAIARNLDWVLEMFPRLRERANQLAGTMSGGEQQMCAIARGLMIRPKLIIFDEPTLGLAPNIVDQIFVTLRDIVKSSDSTILLVEQNASIALEVSDRAYVLENGHMVLEGAAADLLNSREIQKSYLGL